MMKTRSEEGFALAYVTIVIFILCSIAIAIMSYTLNTLQAQEAMVRRMKDKYEAMGEIESFVAELSHTLSTDHYSYYDDGFDDYLSAYSAAVAYISDIISSDDFFDESDDSFSELPSFSASSSQTYSGIYSYSLVATDDDNAVSISAIVDVVFEFTLEDNTRAPTLEEQLDQISPPSNFTYDISLSSPSFSLYEIASYPSTEGGNE